MINRQQQTIWELGSADDGTIVVQHEEIIDNNLEVILQLIGCWFFGSWCHGSDDKIFRPVSDN